MHEIVEENLFSPSPTYIVYSLKVKTLPFIEDLLYSTEKFRLIADRTLVSPAAPPPKLFILFLW